MFPLRRARILFLIVLLAGLASVVVRTPDTAAEPQIPVDINAGWAEFGSSGGSVSGGGISITNGESIGPSVAFANGLPIVAWADYTSTPSQIYLRRWNGASWVTMGGPLNISSTPGGATNPSMAVGSNGNPVVAWTANVNGVDQIYAKRWNGSTAWVELGGSASGLGISNTPTTFSIEPSVAIGHDGNPYIAWTEERAGRTIRDIYLKRWNGSSWVALGGSASDSGINGDGIDGGLGPSLAIGIDGNPFVLWTNFDGINLKRWNGSSWSQFGASAPSDGNIYFYYNVFGRPKLAFAPNGTPFVAWTEDGNGEHFVKVIRPNANASAWVGLGDSGSTGIISPGRVEGVSLAVGPDNNPVVAWGWQAWDINDENFVAEPMEIYVKRWTGSAWVETYSGSASGGGISNNADKSASPSIAVSSTGARVIAWSDDSRGGDNSEIYVRGSCYILTRNHTGNGADPAANPANSTGCPAGQYTNGNISVTAAPATGWKVKKWTGTNNNNSTSNNNSVTIQNSHRAVSVEYELISTATATPTRTPTATATTISIGTATVTATIPAPCYTLSRNHAGQGDDPVAIPAGSTGCGEGQFIAGESITLTAAPAPGWGVSNWIGTDDDGSTSISNVVTMPAMGHAVTVVYEAVPESYFLYLPVVLDVGPAVLLWPSVLTMRL